jgi:hypothetical protein
MCFRPLHQIQAPMAQSTDGGSGPGSSSKVKRRASSRLLLRAVAAANNTRGGSPSTSSLTSVGPPNANGIGMESEGEMMSSSASTGEVGSVDAFVGDCAQGE